MKRFLTFLMCLCLISCVAVLVACGGDDTPTAPTNTNTNTNTGTNTDTSTDTDNTPSEITYNVAIIDQDGIAVPGAVVQFLDSYGDVVEECTANDDGIIVITVNQGEISKLDIIALPEYYLDDVGVISVGEEADISVTVRNNVPNGTATRPYPFDEDTTKVTLTAGQEVYYVLYGGSGRNFKITNAQGIEILFNEETYVADENGEIAFKLPIADEASRGAIMLFKCTGEGAEYTIEITSDPGTFDNPYEVELGKLNEEIIEKEKTIYYKWVATKSGVVMVYSESADNNISINNLTSSAVSGSTDGAICEYLYVEEGDEIKLYVASKNAQNNYNEVNFTVSFHEGTEQDPVPLFRDKTALNFQKGKSIVFECKVADIEAAVLKVTSDSAKVVYEGTEYKPNLDGEIVIENYQASKVFTVVNTDEEARHGISIEIIESAPEE